MSGRDGFADAGAKRYRDGTHRLADPDTTLARLMPLAARMGITRVAVLTGLDVIGIPVVAAYRPNSRSVAVHQGKGTTLAAAKASAVMEAVESYHAENIEADVRLASYRELPAAVAPERLPRVAGTDVCSQNERLLWIAGQDLIGGGTWHVPLELVSADFTWPGLPGGRRFQATTNGLASGNHLLEAVLHGLYEVVERDAMALWQVAPILAQEATVLDPDSVTGPISRRLLEYFAAAPVALCIWDITSDVGLPTFQCMVASRDATEGVEPQLGAGCHADADIALSRALSEAAQARLTVLTGARDDIAAAGYRPAIRAQRQQVAAHWLRSAPRRRFDTVPSCAGHTLRHDLDAVLSRLATRGFDQAIWVDLSRADIGIPVARVIIPDMEGPWTPPDGEYTPGPRARLAAGHRP